LEQFRRWRHGGDAERVASRIQEHPPAPIGLRVYQLGSEGNSLRFGLVEVISCGEIKVNDRLTRPLGSLVVLNALHDHDEPPHHPPDDGPPAGFQQHGCWTPAQRRRLAHLAPELQPLAHLHHPAVSVAICPDVVRLAEKSLTTRDQHALGLARRGQRSFPS